ncbi:MAG: NADP-dependent oxidoreductase [Steroidobacteraceae bacterium]
MKKCFVSLALFAVAAVATAQAPTMMLAVVADDAKAPRVTSIATPQPRENQIRIRIIAAGVNPVDWKSASTGTVLGYDAAGEVDAIGAGVTTFKPGDAVVARVNGSYAQYAIANLDSVVLKPKTFTFEQAAGIPVAGIAGYRAATEAKVSKGQRVAIIGAAGGAGSAAVETAKLLGGAVIGIGHSSQEAYLRKLGATEFVAYDKDNVSAKVRDVDVALNMVDNQADAALGYVKRGGYFSSIAGMPAEGKCQAAGVTCVQIGRGLPGPPTVQSLRPLVEMADRGQYTVNVTRRFPVTKAADAQESLRTSEGMGKTVLIVDAVKAGQR